MQSVEPRGFSPSLTAIKKPSRSWVLNMAVREGFEPSIPFDIHTFQACSFNHSDTSPCANISHKAGFCEGANVHKSPANGNADLGNLTCRTTLSAIQWLPTGKMVCFLAKLPELEANLQLITVISTIRRIYLQVTYRLS